MRYSIICSILLASTTCFAQTPNTDELFNQKKTQLRYLAEQVIALQVYLEQVKEGYKIVDRGLTTLGNIRGGTFTMDNDYLRSLRAVSPIVSGSPRVERITSYHTQSLETLRALVEAMAGSDAFTGDERAYVHRVRKTTITEITTRASELTWLLSADSAEMTDDERLGHLEALCRQGQRTYFFVQNLDRSARFIGRSRAKARQEIALLRRLYGIHPTNTTTGL